MAAEPASAILHTVSQEPPVLRWLHSHDPDRQITAHLLDASATHIASTPSSPSTSSRTPTPSEPFANPSTSLSLFIPMYRRNQFILGQLYSPASPNLVSLNLLANHSHTSLPLSISRRFVVDLSFSTLNFMEYEWFSDGKLSVSIHFVDSDGLYTGETILLDSPEISNPYHYSREDLLQSKNRPAPSKVVARINISEHRPCQICYSQGLRCSCSPFMRESLPRHSYPSPNSWESWISALKSTRLGITTSTVNFTIMTPMGEMKGSNTLFLNQIFEAGMGPSSPNANKLIALFLQSIGSPASPPGKEGSLLDSLGREDNIQMEDELSYDSEDCLSSSGSHMQGGDVDVDTMWPSTSRLAPSLHDADLPREGLSEGSPRQKAWLEQSAFISTTPKEIASAAICADPRSKQSDSKSCDAVPTKYPAFTKEDQPLCENGVTTSTVAATATVNMTASMTTTATSPKTKPPGVLKQRTATRGTLTKRKNKGRGKVFTCYDCEPNRGFPHRGHYNEHRRCVHDKVKDHKCAFANCESRFFKKSDRNRHMRSKHGYTALECPKCKSMLPDQAQLDAHMWELHNEQNKLSCCHCNTACKSASALRAHMKTCKPR